MMRKGRTSPDPEQQPKPLCCKQIISIRDSNPAEAGRFTSDTILSTWNHANPRGRGHQWRVGLTAWTEASQSRTAVIRCMSVSVSSSLIENGDACCSIASCLWLHGLAEAPNQIPSAWLAGAIVGAYARDLGADNTRHRVPDRVFSPLTCGR
jgi:hypothetical protein